MDLLIRNGRVIDPANGLDGPGTCSSRRAASPGSGRTPPGAGGHGDVDAGGRVVAPGLIDIHVHLREPGRSTRRRSRPAPGRRPRADSPRSRAWPTRPGQRHPRRDGLHPRRGARPGVVRVYPIGADARAGGPRAGRARRARRGGLRRLLGRPPVMNSALLRRALEYAQAFGRPIISHAEDAALAEGGVMHEGFVSTDLGLRGSRRRPRRSWSRATSPSPS